MTALNSSIHVIHTQLVEVDHPLICIHAESTVQPTSPAATVHIQPPVTPEEDHLYEIVGMMKTSAEQDTAEKGDEIELSSNAAYGRVQSR